MIRILRLLEYTYETDQRAESDMAHWQVPANGTERHGDMIIKSAIITDLSFTPGSLVYTINIGSPGAYVVTTEGTSLKIEPAPEPQ